MDSITQIALGAVIGQAIGYKKLGNKALVMGAVGGFLPDLDVLTTPIAGFMGHNDPFMGWKYHRYISHAVWFGPALGALMGWGLWRHYGRQAGHLMPWIAIMILSLLTHPLLDNCTVYGTQLLAPFSDHRFYIPSVSIIDPLYTVPLLFALLSLRFKKLFDISQTIAQVALAITTLYLGYGWFLNTQAEKIARAQLADEQISSTRLDAYPTFFQPFLRRVVVWQPDNIIRVGFVGTYPFTDHPPIVWSCKRQVPPDVRQKILTSEEGKVFDWFSINSLSMIYSEDGKRISVTDTRYGLPGESAFGWWGMEFSVTPQGDIHYLTRLRLPRDASWARIFDLMRASYGLPNTFLPTNNSGCEQ